MSETCPNDYCISLRDCPLGPSSTVPAGVIYCMKCYRLWRTVEDDKFTNATVLIDYIGELESKHGN